MPKYIVRVPFESVGYIPLDTEAEPKTSEFKALVENRLQIGNVFNDTPSSYKRDRIQADVVEEDDSEFRKLQRKISEKNKRDRESMTKLSSTLDAIADSLQSKGLVKEATEIDIISNTIDASEKDVDVNQKIDTLKEDSKVIDALKTIASRVKGVSAKLLDELVDMLNRDTIGTGMRTADKQ